MCCPIQGGEWKKRPPPPPRWGKNDALISDQLCSCGSVDWNSPVVAPKIMTVLTGSSRWLLPVLPLSLALLLVHRTDGHNLSRG